MTQFGSQAWAFVRNDMKLPLDFTFMWVAGATRAAKVQVYQYTSDHSGYRLAELAPRSFRFVWRHGNLIRASQPASTIRPILEPWLKA